MPVEQVGPGIGIEQPCRQAFELAEVNDRFQNLLLFHGGAARCPALLPEQRNPHGGGAALRPHPGLPLLGRDVAAGQSCYNATKKGGSHAAARSLSLTSG